LGHSLEKTFSFFNIFVYKYKKGWVWGKTAL